MINKIRGIFYWLNFAIEARNIRIISRKPNDLSVNQLIESFRGIRVWNLLSQNDWLLWSRSLYAKHVILIGGHKGESVKKLLNNIPGLSLVDVYEPVAEYYQMISRLNFDKVRVYNEAIFNGDTLEMTVGSDGSLINSIGRSLPDKIPFEYSTHVQSVKLREAVGRLPQTNNKIDDYTLFMNCEGSEYLILSTLADLQVKPISIFVQNHTATDNPFVNLFHLRMTLSADYYPLVNTNWAWDIWIRKDLVTRTVESLEQNIVD